MSQWFWSNIRATGSRLGRRKDPETEEIKVGASIHGPFNQFESIPMALGETIVPNRREGKPNGRLIALEGSSKGLQLRNRGIETSLKPRAEVIGAMRPDHVLKLTCDGYNAHPFDFTSGITIQAAH